MRVLSHTFTYLYVKVKIQSSDIFIKWVSQSTAVPVRKSMLLRKEAFIFIN